MANDFLLNKWKTWYKLLDVNHDGKISMEDVEESRNKFSDLHHLEADKKKKVLENFAKWWDDYIFRGKKGDISEADFIEMMNADYKADKQKFNEKMAKCMNDIFDVIDTNKDRSISWEEFQISFQAYGQDKIAEDKKFFQAFNPDPKENLVPLKTIADAWIEFLTGEDSSKPNPVGSAVTKA